MRRWRERLEKGGYAGLADRRKGKPSAKRIPLATVEKMLSLYKETYYDLNMRHFHEKLRDKHDIQLSYTWVQKALQGAGLVAKRHKRGPQPLWNIVAQAISKRRWIWPTYSKRNPLSRVAFIAWYYGTSKGWRTFWRERTRNFFFAIRFVVSSRIGQLASRGTDETIGVEQISKA
jgi:hypothetical protein